MSTPGLDLGHVSVLAFLSRLAEICLKTHPGVAPCIKQSDFDTTEASELQMYFRQSCPAFSRYKQIFSAPGSAKREKKASFGQPWLLSSAAAGDGLWLSRSYVNKSATQIAEFLAKKFENPLESFEIKIEQDRNLALVVGLFIKETDSLCWSTPKLLLDIENLRHIVDHYKLLLLSGDPSVDEDKYRACMTQVMLALTKHSVQVSKAIQLMQSGAYLRHSLELCSASSPAIRKVLSRVQQRTRSLSLIQCLCDLSKLKNLCIRLRDTCSELIQMTRVISVDRLSSEGSWSSSKAEMVEQDYCLSSSDSETALDSASHVFK